MSEVKRRKASSYEMAMKLCPTARELEFLYPLELASPRDGEVIVDFPSGGAYLQPHLAKICKGATCLAVEHVSGYRDDESAILEGEWSRLPFANRAVNVVLTLAAIHHVLGGRPAFYQECHRVLDEGGRLIIADVEAGTRPDRFLSEFVAKHSSEGHEAVFLTRETEEPLLEAAGFRVSDYELRKYQWSYPDRRTAIEFCRGLFRLDLATDSEIWDALDGYLGIDNHPSGVRMNWELAMVRADKRSDS
ncbi:MAG TPA: methyltransferase domain-containing protein [Thermoanaerobaculia bacterium]